MTLHGKNLCGLIGCVYIGKLQSHHVFFSYPVLSSLALQPEVGCCHFPPVVGGHLVSGAECGSLQPFWDRVLWYELLSPKGEML